MRLEDGVLHGRGSVDAKGPLCTMLVAASRASFLARPPMGSDYNRKRWSKRSGREPDG